MTSSSAGAHAHAGPPDTKLDRHVLVIAGVVVLGAIMSILDITVVNVALPVIARDLDTGLAGQQWVVDGYMLTLSALLLTGGVAGILLGGWLLGLGGIFGDADTITPGLIAVAVIALLDVAIAWGLYRLFKHRRRRLARHLAHVRRQLALRGLCDHGVRDEHAGVVAHLGAADADLWRQAALIREGVRALGLERPIIVGHSFGGALALAYGLRFPDEIAGVVAAVGDVDRDWFGAWMRASRAAAEIMTASGASPVRRCRRRRPAAAPRRRRTRLAAANRRAGAHSRRRS